MSLASKAAHAPAPATVAVVVTTYNRPDALALVLASLARQSRRPDAVLVADDGSGPETAALLRRLVADFPTPLRHCWQEDAGFRAARVRNLAIAADGSEYLLLVDGDMLLHRHFVADHLAAARPGRFVQGMRALTDADGAARLLRERRIDVGFLEPGLGRRRHTLRLPWLANWLARTSESQRPGGIKTCNQGWWRSDLERLNGFDERYQGWGREDDDLAARAFHVGLRRRSLRFAGLATHLYHPERHQDGESSNDELLAATRAERRIRSPIGLDRHAAGSGDVDESAEALQSAG